MAAPQICKKPTTARQTRITQYLKKVKSWRAKIRKSKQSTWRASKFQVGRMPNNKKYPVLNRCFDDSSRQAPSAMMKEGTTELQIHNVKEEDIGKITHTTIENTKMKTLYEVGRSVCKVYINGTPCGTGLLLFGRFILTNAHVVKNIINTNGRQLSQLVTVTFEEMPETTGQIPVEQNLTAYLYGCDSSNRHLDYALLQLVGSLENLPPDRMPLALLSKCSHSPQEGQIYLTGHPECDVKKTTVAFIIGHEKRTTAFDQYFKMNRGHMAEIIESVSKEKWDFKEMADPHLMTYKANFLFGSSGSPVFQDNCQLVALHTGGYSYKKDGKSYSIIEYAIPIMPIIHNSLYELLHNQVMQNQHKLDYLAQFSREALRGTQDMVRMMAKFITELLLQFEENQIYPSALEVLLNAANQAGQRVKAQLRKALKVDTKSPLHGMSQLDLRKCGNKEGEHSSIKALCRFLLEEQRRSLKDIHLNELDEDEQKMKNRGKAKGRVAREGKMQKKGLLRF